jgi:RNA 2',3'-cyclic 3'-phosphodiesterase
MRSALIQATREAVRPSGGRPVPAGNLHVTLAFLGSVPERRWQELGEIARSAAQSLRPELAPADLSGELLELVFDHLEHWRAAHVLCASPAELPKPAEVLARELKDRLLGGGFTPDLKPFRPHVTVVRKVSRPGPVGRMPPVVWRFAELALVESRTLPEGALYSVVESFPLCSYKKTANNNETA